MPETVKETEAVWTRKIAYVSEQYQEAEKKGVKKVEELYLCTEEEDGSHPVVLGAGNYAVVILAANSVVPANASEFFALKLLRKDTESTIYSEIGLMRFHSEVAKTRNFIGNFPYLVGYRGFGKTVDMKDALRSRRDEKALNDIYGSQLRDVVALNKEEEVHTFLEQGLKVALLGDFYVMKAESGTLGDFLLQEFHWEQNPIYVTSPRWKDQLQNMRSSNDERVNPAKELIKKEKIGLDSQNRSGLGILCAIDKKNPQFANRAVVELFVEMLQPIVELHNREDANAQDSQESQAGWAHRDIKPHNFLVEFNPPTPRIGIKATDLGFVIGTSDAGKKETLSSTKDPGVLALGSYLYRAPEQRESRYEILFEIEPGAAEQPIDQICFLNVGDMAISEGDLFESDNFFLTNVKKSDLGTPIRTTITDAKLEGGKWKLTFSDRLVPRASQILYSGDVVKMTGQHTDLFSLGAALYLLASGGKNPEKFYIKYLEEVPYEGDESETDFGSIARSCFTIAMSLCLQPWDDISKQAETLYKGVLTDEDEEFLRSYRSSQAEVTPVKKKWFGKVNETKQPDKGLAAYLTTLRENPMLRYYASNKNNKPIPFCILFEIVRLMVRGRTHSYVSVNEMKDNPEETGKYGYFALDLEPKARECRDSCLRALAGAQELAFNAGQYPSVADTASQMVFVLRVLFEDIVGVEPSNENGEEKQPPAASGVGTSADGGVETETSSGTA